MVLWFERRNILSNNKIVIIDYNMGNLRSVQKAFEKSGCAAVITNDIKKIQDADKIVLPGVGAFRDGMKHLEKLGLIGVLSNEVLKCKKPFLGICLGMQLLANKSFENGETRGLGFINAEVLKFDFIENNDTLKVPHVGWNNVKYTHNKNILFEQVEDNSDFYFVHSYYFKPKEDVSTSITDYGIDFVSSVRKNNIYAFQFHPEKSQKVGLKVISNFVKLKEGI